MNRFDIQAVAEEFGVDQFGEAIVSVEQIEAALAGKSALDEARDMIDGLRFHGFDGLADEVLEEYADDLARLDIYEPTVNEINF